MDTNNLMFGSLRGGNLLITQECFDYKLAMIMFCVVVYALLTSLELMSQSENMFTKFVHDPNFKI